MLHAKGKMSDGRGLQPQGQKGEELFAAEEALPPGEV